MIFIQINDPDRGTNKEFPDEASAIVWLQDEIARWENAVGSKLIQVGSAFSEPVREWRRVKERIDHFRKRNRTRNDPIDYEESDDGNSLVEFNSRVGKSLIFVLSNLGPDAADAAAISARLAPGEIDWNADAEFRGILLFERVKRAYAEFSDAEADRTATAKAKGIADRIDALTGSLASVDEMISSLATTAAQQRSQLDAELTTYKAEAIEQWRKVGGQAATVDAATKSAVAAAESRFASAMQNAESQLAKTLQDAQSKVDNWTAAQDEQRQLEKPAALWSQRAVTHAANADRWKNWSMGIGFVGLVLAIAVAVLTFLCSRPLFEAAIIEGASDSAKAAAGTLRPTFHYELIFTGAITLAWLTMYLWAMRVLVRLYTTEHHLAIDASARGAMMEAYLGLIEADAANAADRPIVLQALFRPVQDGMVRDDGPPGITPAALLSSIASAKGGSN